MFKIAELDKIVPEKILLRAGYPLKISINKIGEKNSYF